MSDLTEKILEALTKEVPPPSRDTKKLKMIITKVDPDLHRAFKVASAKFGKPMAQVFVLLMRRFIKEVDNFLPVEGPIIKKRKGKKRNTKETANETSNENANG